jgi:hypothetical protein
MPSRLTFNFRLLTFNSLAPLPLCTCAQPPRRGIALNLFFVPLCPCVTLFSFSFLLCPSVPLSLCVKFPLSLCAFAPSRLCVESFRFLPLIFVFSVSRWFKFRLFSASLPCSRRANAEIGRRRLSPFFPPFLANPAPSSPVPAVEKSPCSASLPRSRHSLRRQIGKFCQ